MSDEISAALDNLTAIKNGEEPDAESDDAATTSERQSIFEPIGEDIHATTDADDEVLAAMKREVRATFTQHPFLIDHLRQKRVHCAVADWPSRRGQCKYNVSPEKQVFGKRVPSSQMNSATGNHTILIARGIYENNDEWQDTVRHEIAHAYAYEKYGTSQGHNSKWKKYAQKVGADPSSCAPRSNDDRKSYRLACPEGCFECGKIRRSKKIKKPWVYSCSTCGTSCVSYDRGSAVPQEPGTCAVENIKWSDKRSWRQSDKKL